MTLKDKFYSLSIKRAAYWQYHINRVGKWVIPLFFLVLLLGYILAQYTKLLNVTSAYLIIGLDILVALIYGLVSLYLDLWLKHHHFDNKEGRRKP